MGIYSAFTERHHITPSATKYFYIGDSRDIMHVQNNKEKVKNQNNEVPRD